MQIDCQREWIETIGVIQNRCSKINQFNDIGEICDVICEMDISYQTNKTRKSGKRQTENNYVCISPMLFYHPEIV